MRIYLSMALLVGLAVSACHSPGTESKAEGLKTTEQKKKTATPTSDLSPASQAALLDMMKPYYELKEALVGTNASKADAAASRLLQAMDDTRYKLNTNDATRKAIMDTLGLAIKATEQLINVKDETCQKKRVAFEHISDGIFAMASFAHLKNAGIYRDYCPMAFNNKGAYWLSEADTIRNPYFGKKMLECGEVRDSL